MRVDLEGWTLSNGDREFEFPELTLRPGRTVVVHTGKGDDGDGRRVDVCKWDDDDEGWADC